MKSSMGIELDKNGGSDLCKGCGNCCEAFAIPSLKTRTELVKDDLSERTREWLTNDLIPLTPEDARKTGLFAYDPVTGEHGFEGAGPVQVEQRMFFMCRLFDQEIRQCRDYENRPSPCRKFPFTTYLKTREWTNFRDYGHCPLDDAVRANEKQASLYTNARSKEEVDT